MAELTAGYALVIDDEWDIRELSRMTLEFKGWRVKTAGDGRAGLDLMREEKPALVLVDLMMPAMSGMELCHKMAEELGMTDVPVLLVSAASEKARVVQDFHQLPLAHKAFLHKPFDAEAMIKAVQALLPAASPVASPVVQAPQAATPQSPAVAPTPKTNGGYRVLIVDDEPDIRMLMKTALATRFTVETAENGMAGLEAADAFAPDFILTDINMPHMNGLQMVEAIRRHPILCGAPVFFMTGETDANLPRKAYDVGGNLYLRKPVDPMQLLKFIDHFLEETNLQPSAHVGKISPQKAVPVVSQADAKSGPIRVLVIDHVAEHVRLIRRLMGVGSSEAAKVAGGPFEMISTEDPNVALGNLARWQPDLIIYNTRNPLVDGVAFGQMLALRHKKGEHQVVLTGDEFFPVELDYCKRNFGLDAIRMNTEPDEIAKRLGGPVTLARRHWKPKQTPMALIREEDAEMQKTLKMQNDRLELQRESFRKRYQGIQQFIDNTF